MHPLHSCFDSTAQAKQTERYIEALRHQLKHEVPPHPPVPPRSRAPTHPCSHTPVPPRPIPSPHLSRARTLTQCQQLKQEVP